MREYLLLNPDKMKTKDLAEKFGVSVPYVYQLRIRSKPKQLELPLEEPTRQVEEVELRVA